MPALDWLDDLPTGARGKKVTKREPAQRAVSDDVTPRAVLAKMTKDELIEEIERTQRLLRKVLVYWGKVRSAPSSEYVIDTHFVPESQLLLEIMWKERPQ